MKLLSDVNVLLALTAERSRQHAAVRAWWASLRNSEELCVARPVQMGFLRLLCTEAVMGEDTLTLPQAWSAYAALLASNQVSLVLEPPRLDVTWADLCRPFARSPKVVMDAYLAAFAIAGGYRLVTLDKAFSQFRGLDCCMPCR